MDSSCMLEWVICHSTQGQQKLQPRDEISFSFTLSDNLRSPQGQIETESWEVAGLSRTRYKRSKDSHLVAGTNSVINYAFDISHPEIW